MGSYADAINGVALGADPYDLALAHQLVSNVDEVVRMSVEAIYRWQQHWRNGARELPEGEVGAHDMVEAFIKLKPEYADDDQVFKRAVSLVTTIVLDEARMTPQFWGVMHDGEGYCSGCDTVKSRSEFRPTHPKPKQCLVCLGQHAAYDDKTGRKRP